MQSRRWTTRGRPQGRGHSAANTKLLEYLAKISVKYRVDHNTLFNKIVDAWQNRRSKCKQLTIQCREKTRDRAIFLITTDHKVVAQFPTPEHLLKETAPLKEFAYIIEREKKALMKRTNDNKARYFKIKGLKTGMKRINVKARILAISRPNLALTRYNDYVKFTNVTLTDETGTVKLTLWNDRINSLSINDMVEIENASVTAYKGETQLRIRRHSKLRVVHACNHEEAIIRELEHNPNLNSIVTRGHG
ncbi:MAG: OB-fold nucleic acid binding domain-containing protein [Candidatus Bathyarchaeota archaeon]|nr:OB-fold nucleic acid binding domain-containing protein [Candidatus Bathyarchaeota archaeon]MDH5495269.1 OB-fold nucleic acid binding domain-containing protein [Candidatus Bathyarchaeota archaeon]